MIDYVKLVALLKRELIRRENIYLSDNEKGYQQIMKPSDVLVLIAQLESELMLGIEYDTCGLPFTDPEVE